MKDFHGRGGGHGGPRRFGDRGGFRSGGRGPTELHDATCNNCGKACQVPFRPTGERPVYCRDCFADHMPPRDSGSPRDRGGFKKPFAPQQTHDTRTYTNQSAEVTAELKAIGTKLDRLITILETRPSLSTTIAAPAPKVKRPSAKKK